MNGGIGGIGGGNVSGAARWQTYHRQMDRLRDRRDRLAVRRLDLVLVVTALGLLVVTAAFLVDKSLSFVVVDRSADVSINALTALAAGSLSALALARYREAGRLAGLYQASAFLLIAWISLINVAVVVLKTGAEGEYGLLLSKPEQLPLYVSSITRLVAGALLMVGGAAALSIYQSQPRTAGRCSSHPQWSRSCSSCSTWCATRSRPSTRCCHRSWVPRA